MFVCVVQQLGACAKNVSDTLDSASTICARGSSKAWLCALLLAQLQKTAVPISKLQAERLFLCR